MPVKTIPIYHNTEKQICKTFFIRILLHSNRSACGFPVTLHKTKHGKYGIAAISAVLFRGAHPNISLHLHAPMPYPLREQPLFYCTIRHSVQNLLLAEYIENQNRNQ